MEHLITDDSDPDDDEPYQPRPGLQAAIGGAIVMVIVLALYGGGALLQRLMQ